MKIGQRELRLVAEALINMFGDEAQDRALEQAEERKAQSESDGAHFWQAVAATIATVEEEQDRRS